MANEQAVIEPNTTPVSRRPIVAFGPELPEDTAWQWVGADLASELRGTFETVTFRDLPPPCDVLVIVKYQLPLELVRAVARHAAVLYCPIDNYGCAADLDADWEMLRCCSRVVLHAPLLRKYFQSYAPVETLDHHVKYAAPLRETFQPHGPIVWTGWRSNLPPLAKWLNSNFLPETLHVLTNLDPVKGSDPTVYGFHHPSAVRIEPWSAERHVQLLASARAAIDIKGTDFRQRHKPATKAMDVIASGVPLAMNSDSSSSLFLRGLGFEIASSDDPARWLSEAYWRETREFGRLVRQHLSLSSVGARMRQVIEGVLQQRRAA
jgi:hypothetical protein